MVDQCIICLEDLDSTISENNHLHSPSDATPTSAVDQSEESLQLSIAVIKPCNHILHDPCLQTWTQKANSCPICRQNFNEVEVYDKVGGNLLSTYAVADKKQVADFDYLSWVGDNPEDVESAPCPICNETDQEESLLICDGCDANYHIHCIGLLGIPRGDWFCMECVAGGAVNQATVDHPRPQDRRNRLQAQRRRANRARSIRRTEWQGAWDQISSRVWENLNLDLDFNESDSAMADFRRHELQLERERSRWQQRLRIASRQGASDLFRDATRPILHRARELPVVEPQETAEEAASWRAMERAQELERPNATSSRKRKSRSTTASANTSPAEPPAEPERKLKRPRTRRVLDTGATSDGAAESSRRRRSIPSRRMEQQASSPSFLSSLLKEVESSPVPDNDNRHFFDGSPGGIAFSDQSSRAVSPASSNYSTPRGMSITPPPPNSKRPSSPLPLTSHVMPAFPASNYSPTRASPDNEEHEASSPSNPELRMPRPRNRTHKVVQRSDELSPTRASMSLEAKEDINKIVKAALKAYWRPGGITKDQYMEVNKLVSRILYDKITDPLDETSKSMWEKIAQTEVAKAVKELEV